MSLKWTSPKDPDEVKDYSVDWSLLLATASDAIATSVWTIPASLTEDSSSHTTTTSTIWLSGGVAGESYPCLNRITTTGGRTYDRTIYLKMKTL